MFTSGNLDTAMRHLLPHGGSCAHRAAAKLLRAMLVNFTCVMMHLARQARGDATARSRRQYFARWLERPHWDPATLYAGLNREARRALRYRRHVPVLVDITELSDEWAVLQISLPWEGRALPLYRRVTHVTDPEEDRRTQMREACAFVREHLPGTASRYVLVMDRGFPGHWLIKHLQAKQWRYAIRVSRRWKATHDEYTGVLREADADQELVGPRPRLLRDVEFGRRDKGADEWSVAHLVMYHGVGYKEPWYLVTSEEDARRVVAIYRERMKIECEFRDLKGPVGLDEVARWQDRAQVGRFLALVAVYEWRLAALWVRHQLREWGPQVTKYGKLSWIRITREWIQDQIRQAAGPVLDGL